MINFLKWTIPKWLSPLSNFAKNRWTRTFWGLTCVILMSGIIFGWSILIPVLVRSGMLGDRCDETSISKNDDSSESCSDQRIALNLVYQIGSSSVSVAAILMGAFLDYAGPKITMILCTFLISIGSIIFAVAGNSIALYTIAAFLIASPGMGILLTTCYLGLFFPKRKGLVITLVNSCFDASAGVFLLFSLLNTLFGWQKTTLFILYGVLVFTMGTISILIYPWRYPKSSHTDPNHNDRDAIVDEYADAMEMMETSSTSEYASSIPGEHEEDNEPSYTAFDSPRGRRNETNNIEIENDDNSNNNNNNNNNLNNNNNNNNNSIDNNNNNYYNLTDQDILIDDENMARLHHDHQQNPEDQEQFLTKSSNQYIRKSDSSNISDVSSNQTKSTMRSNSNWKQQIKYFFERTFNRQFRKDLCSPIFIGLNLFMALHALTCNIYFGGAHDILNNIDSGLADTFVHVLGFILPGAVIFAPGVGWIIDNKGQGISFFTLNISGVIFLICVLIPVIYFHIVTFIVFTFYRAFLYSAASALIFSVFGIDDFGKLIGVLNLVIMLGSLLQYAVYNMVQRYLHDYLVVMLVFMGLQLISLIFPFYIWLMERRGKLKQQKVTKQ